jgi:hypothetical protein
VSFHHFHVYFQYCFFLHSSFNITVLSTFISCLYPMPTLSQLVRLVSAFFTSSTYSFKYWSKGLDVCCVYVATFLTQNWTET